LDDARKRSTELAIMEKMRADSLAQLIKMAGKLGIPTLCLSTLARLCPGPPRALSLLPWFD
jgi:hypothetical protein